MATRGESVETRVVEPRAKYIVLLLLAEGPKTGYELLKNIRSLLADVGGGVSPGTIYPLLRSLEEEGCIEIIEERREGRKRKVYRLTAKGARILATMAAKGLSIMEILLRLHLRAAEKLGTHASLFEAELLREIISRLRVIDELTRAIRELIEAGVKGYDVTSGPAEKTSDERGRA